MFHCFTIVLFQFTRAVFFKGFQRKLPYMFFSKKNSNDFKWNIQQIQFFFPLTDLHIIHIH